MALQEFAVPHGYDEATGEYGATLYYCEHEELDENLVQLRHREANVFDVRWVGVTQDVNYYDGSKPPTRVEIEGRFLFLDFEKL